MDPFLGHASDPGVLRVNCLECFPRVRLVHLVQPPMAVIPREFRPSTTTNYLIFNEYSFVIN